MMDIAPDFAMTETQTRDYNDDKPSPELSAIIRDFPDALVPTKDITGEEVLGIRPIYPYISQPLQEGTSQEELEDMKKLGKQVTEYYPEGYDGPYVPADNPSFLENGLKSAMLATHDCTMKFTKLGIRYKTGEYTNDLIPISSLGQNDKKRFLTLLKLADVVGKAEKAKALRVTTVGLPISLPSIAPTTSYTEPQPLPSLTTEVPETTIPQPVETLASPLVSINSEAPAPVESPSPSQTIEQEQTNLRYLDKWKEKYSRAFSSSNIPGEEGVLRLRTVVPFLNEPRSQYIAPEVYDTIRIRMSAVIGDFPYDKDTYVPADDESFRNALTQALYSGKEDILSFSKNGLQYSTSDGHIVSVPIGEIGEHDRMRLIELLEVVQLIKVEEDRLGIKR